MHRHVSCLSWFSLSIVLGRYIPTEFAWYGNKSHRKHKHQTNRIYPHSSVADEHIWQKDFVASNADQFHSGLLVLTAYKRSACRIDTCGGKRDKQYPENSLALFNGKSVAEPPELKVRLSRQVPFHRSTLLMSLFSSMVRCSMIKPLGLSSERDVFWSWQSVTSERSVTLLSRIIIWRAYVLAL